MTREQKIEAFTLLIDGFTYKQIGEHMGCTKQCVQETLANCIRGRKSRLEGCVYPNMANCMMSKKTTLTELYKVLHPDEPKIKNGDISYIKRRLQGTTNFSAKEWLKLSNYFGISVEKLMMEEYAECVNSEVQEDGSI